MLNKKVMTSVKRQDAGVGEIGKERELPLPPAYKGLGIEGVIYLERMMKSALRFLAQASSD